MTFDSRHDVHRAESQGSTSRIGAQSVISSTKAKGDSPSSLPSYCSSPRWIPPLDLASAPTELKIDTSMQSMRAKGIRPLPPIPATASPSSSTIQESPQYSPRVLRPLPSPPTASPRSASSCTSAPTCSLSKAPQIQPPAYEETAQASLPPPTLQARPVLPLLSTGAEFLKPMLVSGLDPNSPGTPQPPTPQTAKRKRMSKLRRHLGERIPEDAVRDPIIKLTNDAKDEALEKLHEFGENRIYVTAAIAVGKILDMEPEEEGSEDGSEEIDEDQLNSPWVPGNGTIFSAAANKCSKKWVHEKGGRRWEEPDYQNILQALRAL